LTKKTVNANTIDTKLAALNRYFCQDCFS